MNLNYTLTKSFFVSLYLKKNSSTSFPFQYPKKNFFNCSYLTSIPTIFSIFFFFFNYEKSFNKLPKRNFGMFPHQPVLCSFFFVKIPPQLKFSSLLIGVMPKMWKPTVENLLINVRIKRLSTKF